MMKRMKSLSSILISMILIMGTLSACGGGGSANTSKNGEEGGSSSNQSKPTKKNVTLSVMASQDHIMDAEVKLAKSFEEETGIKIDYQIVPADQFQTLIGAKLNAGEGPDVIVAQSGKLTLKSTLDPEKNLEDLSSEAWGSQIKAPFAESVSYNGKIYGLPLWDFGGSSSWVFIYNKKIFEEQKLTPPKTFNQLLEVSAKLLEAGITPIYEPAADGWHQQLPLLEMGAQLNKLSAGSLYDQLNENTAVFADNSNGLMLLEQLQELVDKGYYGKEYFSQNYAGAHDAMATGKFAMIIDRSNFGNELVESVKDSQYKASDFGAFVMPFLDNQILNVNPQGPSKFIYKNSKHIEEAKQFLAYLAKPENLQTYLNDTPRFSELPFEGVEAKANVVLEEIKAGSNGEEGTVLQAGVSYIDPQWTDIGKDIMAMFGKKLNPEQVLQNIDKRRNQQANAQKDPAWTK